MSVDPRHRLRLGLFYRYFFSYVSLVALVLGIISVIIVGVFLRDFEKKARASSADKLYEVRQIMDLRLERLEHTLVTQVALDPRLTPLHLSGSVASAYGVTAILNDYRIHEPEVFDIALYYSGDPVVYSGDGSYPLSRFFSAHFVYSGTSAGTMERAIVSPSVARLVGTNVVAVDNGLRLPLLTYVYPVPISSNDTLSIILFIDAAQFSAPIDDFSRSSDGELFLFDRDGNPIYLKPRSGGVDLSGSNFSNLSTAIRSRHAVPGGAAGIDRMRLGRRDYAVMVAESKNTELVYCLITPESEYTRDVRGITTTIAATIAGIFLLGLGLAFLLSTRQYAPLARLRQMLPGTAYRDRALLSRGDEMESLEQNLGIIISQNRELIARVEHGDRYLHDQLFLRLLSGEHTNASGDLDSFFRSSGLGAGSATVVCIFRDEVTPEQDRGAAHMDEILVALEHAARSGGGAYGVCMPDGHLVVVLAAPEDEHSAVLDRFVRAAQRLIRDHYRMDCTIAVGETCHGIAELHESYMTARTAALHRFQLGRGRIIYHRDIAPAAVVPTFIALENQHQIERLLRSANRDEANAACRTVFNEIAARHLPIDAATYLANSLLATVVRVVEELNIPFADFLRSHQSDRIVLVGHFQTIQDFQSYVLSLIDYVCVRLRQRGNPKSPILFERMVRYLESHVTDSQIGMKQLSYDLGVSASYAARLFREQTGLTIMSWVDNQRIALCKRYLSETAMPLDEILAKTGYLDKTNFVRKFKRITGVTPMRFRTLNASSHRTARPAPVSGSVR